MMKKNIKILVFLLALIASSVIFAKKSQAQQGYVSFQLFYDQLSPYGQWVEYPNYGYVWVPSMGEEFAPYSSGGYWLLTDYGWTWISTYEWGWAPFHYGRWGNDSYYGWFWVPDNEWGPSWVNWRRAEGYYGWAPMEPGSNINIGFNFVYNSQNDHWVFVRDRDIERSDIYRCYVNRNEHQRIFRNSNGINKTYIDKHRHSTYVYGPAREDVEKSTGRKVKATPVQESNNPGPYMNKGQVRMYRPVVNKNTGNGHKPAPVKVAKRNEVKKPSERNKPDQPKKNNPTKNNGVKQPPQNRNSNNTKPVPPQKSNPSKNKGTRQPAQSQPPQNRNNHNTKPVPPQNSNPSKNNGAKQPTQSQPPQNRNNHNTKPVPPQKSNPSKNNGTRQPAQSQPPQNRNNNNTKPVQPQRSKPGGSQGVKQPPKTVNQPNNQQPKRNN